MGILGEFKNEIFYLLFDVFIISYIIPRVSIQSFWCLQWETALSTVSRRSNGSIGMKRTSWSIASFRVEGLSDKCELPTISSRCLNRVQLSFAAARLPIATRSSALPCRRWTQMRNVFAFKNIRGVVSRLTPRVTWQIGSTAQLATCPKWSKFARCVRKALVTQLAC